MSKKRKRKRKYFGAALVIDRGGKGLARNTRKAKGKRVRDYGGKIGLKKFFPKGIFL